MLTVTDDEVHNRKKITDVTGDVTDDMDEVTGVPEDMPGRGTGGSTCPAT